MGMNHIDGYSMNNSKCFHRGGWHTGPCPRIKAIEYYENGTVKRVEYYSEENFLRGYQDKVDKATTPKPEDSDRPDGCGGVSK